MNDTQQYKMVSGQTLSELVLIIMGIVIVSVLVLTLFGNQLAGMFTNVVNAF